MAAERAEDASWQLTRAPGSSIIAIRCFRPTSTREIPDFINALTAAMPASRATLVFDLRGLEVYNPDTKEPIKTWLIEHKLAIESVTVIVSESPAILKIVIAAVGLAVGVKIQVRDDLDGIDEAALFATKTAAS